MRKYLNHLRAKGFTKFNAQKVLYRLTHIRKWKQGQKKVYLVYTPGKVGSQSIYLTLRNHLMESNVFHIHFLSYEWLCKHDFDGSEKATVVQQVKQIYSLLRSDINLKIICIVRDPISKTISQLFQTPKAFGIPEKSLLKLSPIEISDLLIAHKKHFYSSCEWFDNEFFKFTTIDVYQKIFDHVEKKQVIESNNIHALILRTEDLKHEDLVLENLGNFVEKPIRRLIIGNRTENKTTGELYREVKSIMRFPEDFLKQIYSSKYCQHFYTKQEVNSFIDHWKL